MKIINWDICQYLHAMNDFGIDQQATKEQRTRIYSKSRTYNAECYAEQKGIECKRKGRCIIALFRKNFGHAKNEKVDEKLSEVLIDIECPGCGRYESKSITCDYCGSDIKVEE